jgi:Fe-S cluster biosynthesis and repair protein YggX
MSDFKCHKCSLTPGEPTGAAGLPLEPMTKADIPVFNDYWTKVMSVTCRSCWAEWKDMEVKIINEYRLNMLEREHRKMIRKFMNDFLNLDGTSSTTGMMPAEVATNLS